MTPLSIVQVTMKLSPGEREEFVRRLLVTLDVPELVRCAQLWKDEVAKMPMASRGMLVEMLFK